MHSGNETWSALGKYWLKKFDKDTVEDFFLCKCSNIKGLKLNRIPKCYLNALHCNHLANSAPNLRRIHCRIFLIHHYFVMKI